MTRGHCSEKETVGVAPRAGDQNYQSDRKPFRPFHNCGLPTIREIDRFSPAKQCTGIRISAGIQQSTRDDGDTPLSHHGSQKRFGPTRMRGFMRRSGMNLPNSTLDAAPIAALLETS
jgi:hypothetical protein